MGYFIASLYIIGLFALEFAFPLMYKYNDSKWHQNYLKRQSNV